MRESWKVPLPFHGGSASEQRVHMDAPDAEPVVASAIYQHGQALYTGGEPVIVMCIGTDRSIGDALGPLIGTELTRGGHRRFEVLGTLDNPVHASNLSQTLQWVSANYQSPLIFAVDACLGRSESVGMISVGRGSLKPGAGVNKTLPAVGQVYVTGVVNVGGYMEYFVLQNTRLSLVMRMAEVAARGIAKGLNLLTSDLRASGAT